VETKQIGPYQLLDLLGRGGMAVVYTALQPALRRRVAVKILHPQLAHAEDFRARFQDEAELIASLDHPNILPIYDYGHSDEGPYIVMPLVTGGTLREWLGRSLPMEQVLQVFSRVLDAVEYAHSQEPAIIHRDIKPTNILMRNGDWPLLADFGLAEIAGSAAIRSSFSGAVVGTPEYMAPELCSNTAADQRSDLYALGIMLYKILAGRVPFQSKVPLEVIKQQVRAPVPSPRTFNPDLSPVWDEVLQRCLAKNPDDRYQSAKAMDEAIQAAWSEARPKQGTAHTVGTSDVGELYQLAKRALEESNWPRAMSLCSEILSNDSTFPGAVELLAHAHDALHRQNTTLHGRQAVELAEQARVLKPKPVETAPAPIAVLGLVHGDAPSDTYGMDGREVTFGRGADNMIAIPNAEMSRRHCRIYWDGASYVVEDLGSSNGTRVNGEKVQTAPLKNGDQIQMGSLVFEFRLVSSAPVQAPARPDAANATSGDGELAAPATGGRAAASLAEVG
jgi:serine/threonine protein kinase